MEAVLDSVVKALLHQLIGFINGEMSNILGVKKDLEMLQRKLSRIQPHIQVAEKIRRRDPAINNWLKELKHIMYDAEDIFDLCLIEGERLLEARRSSSSVVYFNLRSSISSVKLRRNICGRIKIVNDKLHEIEEGNNVIPSWLVAQGNQGFQDNSTSSPTSSTHVATDIVGSQIEDAAQKLISEIEQSKKKCSVLGISGMGGIGKTTLAQKIFNDELMKKQFPNRVWLHVPKHYSEIEKLKEVLRGLGGKDNDVQSRVEVEGRIITLLSESLLLVLDDIWSKSVWRDLLRNVILKGSCRTVILFTTRHEDVVTEMKADFVHNVAKMHNDSGWELIRKIVFGDEEDVIISELEEVGMEIVKKCDGLPLAVKVMAGVLLHKEKTTREWQEVLESDLWSIKERDVELSNALYLSYEDLPSHLRQCFLSCAFYHDISFQLDIIRLWVSEGFVIEQSKKLMENIAEDYYKDLIARNLLQIDHKDEDETKFVMHDVLRSFGEKLMKEEGIIISDASSTSQNFLTKIRHLSISNQDDVVSLPAEIRKQKCLRTLYLVNCSQIKRIEDHVFESLKCLRVLDLSDTSIDSLPDSLVKLVLLKYLDLGRTKIRNLPKSIGRLVNLQTLNISGCKSLHELPESITELINLRCLRIVGTPLTHLPKGIGKLENLNHLAGFFVGHCDSMSEKDGGCDLDELQHLHNLIDLVMNKLERATTRGNGNLVLANKPILRRLTLEWTMNNNEYNEEQITEAERICSQFSPPATIEVLWIENFPGQQFPDWMVSTSANLMTNLSLCDFPSCVVLPPLGQLPNLKYLQIIGGEEIRSIGPEFLGCRTPAFPKLEHLAFDSMRNWETWELHVAQDVHASNSNLFPNLKKCYFYNCPKLKKSILPPTRLLQINLCPKLESVEKVGMLQEFEVVLPSEIKQLPQWISSLINMTSHSLQLFNMQCDSLIVDSCRRGKQNWHIIRQIPRVIIHSIQLETRLLLGKDGYKYQKKDEFGSFITRDQQSFQG